MNSIDHYIHVYTYISGIEFAKISQDPSIRCHVLD